MLGARARRRRARLPRGVRPRGGRPDPRLRRHRHRRGCGPGRLRRGGQAVAVRGTAAEPGRLDHHHRAQPGHRPAAPRGGPRRQARSGGAAARRGRADRGGPRARRPAAAHLHLLPPGARHRPPRSRSRSGCSAGSPRPRSRAPSWCRSRPWPSGWSGPRPRSGTPGSRTASRPRPTCPPGCPACSRSSTSSSTRATRRVRARPLARADLCAEAIRLGRLLAQLMPDEPEVLGLLALMLLTESRRAARTSADGALVLLADQDRSRWDRALIAEGQALVRQCLRRGQPGPYQIQAAISAVHSDAPIAAATDWSQILRSTTSCWPSRRARWSRSTGRSRWPRSTARPPRSPSSTARPRPVLPVPRDPRRPAAAAGPPRRGRRRLRGRDRAGRQRGRACPPGAGEAAPGPAGQRSRGRAPPDQTVADENDR